MPNQIIHLDIEGMTCQACASRIEKVLAKKPAIAKASVNFANESAEIAFDKSQASIQDIIDWINKSGFVAHIQHQDSILHQHSKPLQAPIRLILIWLCLLPFGWGMVGMLLGKHDMMPPIWLQFVLATVVQFGLAMPLYFSAWASVKDRLANMDVLVVLGTLTIWCYSTYMWLLHRQSTVQDVPYVYFEAGVMVIAFVRLGKYLEQRTKKQSLNSIHLLLELIPQQVPVKVNHQWQHIPLASVQVGDILQAKQGDRIACDGIVTALSQPTAWCDEHHLSGESLPVAKQVNSHVMAGALLTSGTIEYQAVALGHATALGDMITALNEAQSSKAQIARLADRVAGVFVPAIVVIAVLTFVVNLCLLNALDTALMRAVAVLVIACPCALGLATPAAIMAGVGLASRQGVWFKHAHALELTGTVDTVVFDKTGTLTTGQPQVIAHYLYEEQTRLADIAQITAALEAYANHPLANAMLEFAQQFDGANQVELKEVTPVVGQGIQGLINGVGMVKVGRLDFIGISLPPHLAEQHLWTIASIVAVSINDKPAAVFGLSDTLKEDSITAIAQLKQQGLEPIIMSGDRQSVVDYIGQQVQIKQCYGDLSPRDKANLIKTLQAQGKKVAMVGDGINDAPALAIATASFAVQKSSDIAQHSATARLIGNPHQSVAQVAVAIRIARATLRNIKQNLFFACIYNLLGICFAMLGLLNPMIAAAAMAFSSISVLANALRLTRLTI